MPLPGYEVNLIESPPSPSVFTDISTGFACGKATNEEFGLVYSIDQFVRLFGDREAQSPLYDGVQVFFREGGFRCYVATCDMDGTNDDVIAAAAQFTNDLGPGTLFAPGITDPAFQLEFVGNTQTMNRIALLDAPDTNDIEALVQASAAITGKSSANGDRFSAMFAPWDIAPGLLTGTTRTTPPSARVAGNLARNDSLGYSSGDPAAAALGIARYVQGLSQPAWNDDDRTELNESSINVSRQMLNSVRTYGWRSLADQTTDTDWSMFNAARIVLAVKASLDVVAENFVFSKLDSMARVTAKFGGAISAVLLDFYNNGDLYGDTPQDAYIVDTGPAVNTDQSFAQGYLQASVGIRTASMGERVVINVAKIPITESLGATSTTTTS